MLLFVVLALASVILEVYDFPPLWKTFDTHSLWHFSSAPISILFYKLVESSFLILEPLIFFILIRFITEDCKQLRKEMPLAKEDKQKLL